MPTGYLAVYLTHLVTPIKMPVFHTKTIEGILEPVAQQVSSMHVKSQKKNYLSSTFIGNLLFYEINDRTLVVTSIFTSLGQPSHDWHSSADPYKSINPQDLTVVDNQGLGLN